MKSILQRIWDHTLDVADLTSKTDAHNTEMYLIANPGAFHLHDRTKGIGNP